MILSKETAISLKIDWKYYLHCIIGLFLMFGFGHLSPIEPITSLGMKVLGIFIGCIYMWSFLSCLWPSILGLIALGISGYAPFKTVLLNSFGDTTSLLVLFAMILFGAIDQSGATKYVSRWFLTRRIINGRPIVFSFIMIYTAYVLSALGSTLPAILFMWAVLYNLLSDVGYKKGDKYSTLMVIGVLFGGISGQAFKPFAGSPLMMIASFEKVAGTKIDYLSIMLFGFIMSTLAIMLYSLLIKFVFRPDLSKIANISTERFKKDKLPPMTLIQRIYLFCLFGFMTFVVLPSIFTPRGNGIIAVLNQIGPHGIAMAFVVVLCMLKIEGKPILAFKEIVGRHVTWDVYFLVAMAMVISTALTVDSTGIKPFLTQTLNPLLGNHSPMVLTAILATFCIMITQIANNAVMGVLLMPIMYTFAMQNGMNATATAAIMVYVLHMALITPAASPYAAVLYGNKEWVEGKDIAKYGTIVMFGVLALYLLIGIPIANMIFKG